MFRTIVRTALWICVPPLAVGLSACGDDVGHADGDAEPTAKSAEALVDTLALPGLVMGLLHNVNNTVPVNGKHPVMYSALYAQVRYEGGDLGAPSQRGFEWWGNVDPDIHSGVTPNAYAGLIPPGVVVALRHNRNQPRPANPAPFSFATAFGYDAPTGPSAFPGFTRQVGGDLGAPSGVGYFWYESTGAGFTNWANVDSILPKYTVVGLKHSQNQASKRLVWNGVVYDPVQPSPVPPGFRRVVGGDLGAPNGVGYFWYEKLTGPEKITRPTLERTLSRNLFLQSGETRQMDKDNDRLVDSMENDLADWFTPYAVFDSEESGRRDGEPFGIFRVTPVSNSKIRVRYVPLFIEDAGYGPSSVCDDSHPGDNDTIDYDLETYNGGTTWKVTRVNPGFKGINWPGNSRLEVHMGRFPIVYQSGSKHHQFLTKDHDGKNSPYSEYACNDDVNGLGAKILLQTKNRFPGVTFHNVGEPGAHPSTDFVNDLSGPFDGHTVWGGEKFYEVGPNKDKFRPLFRPNDFDGNGTSDIALLGGPGWGTLPIAFSNGDNTFRIANDNVGGTPTLAQTVGSKVAGGDFNGDGKGDLAFLGNAGAVSMPVMLSTTQPGAVTTFTAHYHALNDFPNWSAASGAKAVSGDFNGDGFFDVALTGGIGWSTIPIAFSNGNGSFRVVNYGVTDFPYFATLAGAKPVSGDFNGDGFWDIALTGGSGWGSIPVAFSLGTGAFQVTNYWLGDFPGFAQQNGARPIAGDFNGDGFADVALSGGAGWGSLPVAFSNGNGTFWVTNGGVPDLFPQSNGVVWSRYPGFADDGGVKLVGGDFNNDGLSDVAAVGGSGSSFIAVALSSGNGTFKGIFPSVSSFGSWATQGTPVTY
jgi:hypothetical protein